MNLTRRAIAKAAAMLLLGAVLLPAAGFASSGGLALPDGHTPRLQSGSGTLLHRNALLTGTLPSASAGAPVSIERQDARRGWVAIAHAVADRNGDFSALWHTDRPGRFALRARTQSSRPTASSSDASASGAALGQITVLRPAIATYYGEAVDWGAKTACGQTLTARTLGVAHRTLRCGTKVAIYYHGRSITVPVIDRGPYANGADWDLTAAAAKLLHFDGVQRIGAVALTQR